MSFLCRKIFFFHFIKQMLFNNCTTDSTINRSETRLRFVQIAGNCILLRSHKNDRKAIHRFSFKFCMEEKKPTVFITFNVRDEIPYLFCWNKICTIINCYKFFSTRTLSIILKIILHTFIVLCSLKIMQVYMVDDKAYIFRKRVLVKMYMF